MSVDPSESPVAITVFRYIGTSYMLFYGPSGRKYRFSGHGAELAVDERDVDFVRNVPNLREISAERRARALAGSRHAQSPHRLHVAAAEDTAH